MNILAKTVAAAAIATATLAAAPAAAQVSGVAISSPETVFLRSAARQAAYQQISTTFAAQLTQITTLRNEAQAQQQTLDTNSDGQVSDAEAQANQAVTTQVQQKLQQISQASQPITIAQTYVIEQLLMDYGNAQQQVIQSKNIQLLLPADTVQYASDTADVTGDILATLDQRMPTVQANPPANWRPRRESLALQQTIQQILAGLAQQQAAQAAQAAQQGAAATQPTGR